MKLYSLSAASFWILFQTVAVGAATSGSSNNSTTTSAPSTSTAATAAKAGPNDMVNFTNWFFWAWASVLAALMIFTFVTKSHQYVRLVSALNDERQTYFTHRGPMWGFIRKHIIEAPLFRTRHHREFQINSVINMGTLPNRFQTVSLFLYLVFQTVFLLYDIDFSATKVGIVSSLLSRSGILATINMLPLFLLGTRNNPFLRLCDISFDTFNLLHRWMGRMTAFMALLHGVLWVVKAQLKATSSAAAWTAIDLKLRTDQFTIMGLVGLVGLVVIFLSSPSALRHAFYETFLHIHILASVVVIIGLWFHLAKFPVMTQVLRAVIGIWVAERTIRILRILYYNVGGNRTLSRAKIERLPGDAVRITCYLTRPWLFKPGQHAYVYIPAIGLWTSHPLSVAWAAPNDTLLPDTSSEKGLIQHVSPSATITSTEISFICRRRTGFTDSLYKKVDKAPNRVVELTTLLEGPYGGQDLRSFGTVVLFAAGVGITHQLPHIRDLVAAYSTGACATRRVLLVWCIGDQEQLEWIRSWMTEILSMPQRRDVLRVQLYVTRPTRAQEIQSPSATVQMFPGRPNIKFIMDKEVNNAIGAIGVSCCGVGSMADDVRKTCREYMDHRAVTFMEESFSW